jgi:hypothetical protein
MNDNEALQGRIDQLIKMGESRRGALDKMVCNQDNIILRECLITKQEKGF